MPSVAARRGQIARAQTKVGSQGRAVVWAVLGVLAWMAWDSVAAHAASRLERVQTEIVRQGLTWQASETSVSDLGAAGFERRLGSRELPEGSLDFEIKSLPSELVVDWRDQGGRSWLGPVLDQGNCGSCVAFAALATLEAQLAIALERPYLAHSVSPQALFACIGSCANGSFPRSATKHLEREGALDEACLPYTAGVSGREGRCGVGLCRDAAQRRTRVVRTRTAAASGGSVDQVMEALVKGPVMTTLRVYEDFQFYRSGVYRTTGGKVLGGHAVSIVGYDAPQRYWIIRNSWGEGWGEKGYARVSWEDTSGVGVDTWGFEVPAPVATWTIAEPADRTYWAGDAIVRVIGPEPGPVRVSARSLPAGAIRELGRCVLERRGEASECTLVVPTQSQTAGVGLADGGYELSVMPEGRPQPGPSKRGKPVIAATQPRHVWVANQRPQGLALKLASVSSPLDRPLQGRVEFTIQAASGAVPFRSLEFVLSQRGVERVRRLVRTVTPELVVGYRTSALPDGEYELILRAELPYGNGQVALIETPARQLRIQNQAAGR